MKYKKILFVCIENACRSQMAEAFARKYLPNTEIISAGLQAVDEINPKAVKVMEEVGIPMEDHYPKLLTPEMVKGADLAVTMGCIEQCPLTPREITVDWDLEDPASKDLAFFRKTRDIIKKRVLKLVDESK